MARRRELHLILILVVIAAILVIFTPFLKSETSREEASNFVLEDLESKYPGSDIEILTVNNMTNENGGAYFELKAKVTKYQNSKCPERFHIFYNYPEQNFVAAPKEVITDDCRVCTEGICTIAFKEEAIIASHTFNGTGGVDRYLVNNPDAKPEVTEKNDSWSILWHTDSSGYEVELHRNGTILNLTSFN